MAEGKTVGGWGPSVDSVVPPMPKNGQGSRKKGVGMETNAPGLSQQNGYETNYKGLPGSGNNS